MRPTLFNMDLGGVAWEALPNLPGAMVSVYNTSGSTLTIRRKGVEDTENEFTLRDGAAWSFKHITNANEIEVFGTGIICGEVEPT